MLDTTIGCTTLPTQVAVEIPKDNAVEHLHNVLQFNSRVIVVHGANGAGKTVLLAQFARSYPAQCFSCFIGTSPTKSDPHFVLLELCEQMAMVLGAAPTELHSLPTDNLKALFYDFQRRISVLARKQATYYFFVIDGLELLSDVQMADFIKFLPVEPLAFCSLLTTCETGRKLPFQHEITPILPFSEREMETYFDGLGLSKDEIKRLKKSSGGLPGYLSVVKRLLTDGTTLEPVMHFFRTAGSYYGYCLSAYLLSRTRITRVAGRNTLNSAAPGANQTKQAYKVHNRL